MNLLGDAVKNQQLGFHIFPLNECGQRHPEKNHLIDKEPHVTTPPYRIKWSEAATDDIRRVVQYWSRWPEANIGVACKPSGLLVVDCDIPKHAYQLRGQCCTMHPRSLLFEGLHELLGPMVDGETVYDQLCERAGGNWQEVSDTYRVATGSGGTHYYYRWPDGLQASQASIVKGILDIRCNGGERGGYVLGAGSETAAGSYIALGDRRIREAPDWLVGICKEQRTIEDVPRYERPSGSVNYGGLADAVAYAPEGNRNNCLLWAARSMCTDGASQDEALSVLGEAAAIAGLTTVETRDTIRSAYRLQGMRG